MTAASEAALKKQRRKDRIHKIVRRAMSEHASILLEESTQRRVQSRVFLDQLDILTRNVESLREEMHQKQMVQRRNHQRIMRRKHGRRNNEKLRRIGESAGLVFDQHRGGLKLSRSLQRGAWR